MTDTLLTAASLTYVCYSSLISPVSRSTRRTPATECDGATTSKHPSPRHGHAAVGAESHRGRRFSGTGLTTACRFLHLRSRYNGPDMSASEEGRDANAGRL